MPPRTVSGHCAPPGVDLYPHRFRHHFSHTWLDRGGPEGDLMELNGWSFPQMLARYGASARRARARRARARRACDRIMGGHPVTGPAGRGVSGAGNPRATMVSGVAPGPDRAGDYAACLGQFFTGVRIMAMQSSPVRHPQHRMGAATSACAPGHRHSRGQMRPGLRHYD
jgi:hypothetical protein